MDPNILTKLLTAGAMGASIFCIWKVYDLLQNEQDKDEPRPIFIRTIYVAMGFAVVMTLLSLGIEVARHKMGMDTGSNGKLSAALGQIAQNRFYSLDKQGKPQAIILPIGDSILQLSQAFPSDFFKDNELIIKKLEDKYLVQREHLGLLTTTGHLREEQFQGLFGNTPPPPPSNAPIPGEDILNLGLAYTPGSISNALKLAPSRDEALAVNYLIRLLDSSFQDKPNLQKKAVRLLTQPQLMQQLKQSQYDVLINVLESGEVRRSPYNAYELAQIYHSRAFQSWNRENRQADLDQYKAHLSEYIQYYEAHSWIRNAEDYPTEAAWYANAKSELQ